MATVKPRPAGHDPLLPQAPVVVLLGGPAGARGAYRVEAPGRVLRMWSVLNAADDELRQVTLPPEALPRLRRLVDTVRAELERSVSPALAAELRHLTACGEVPCGRDELRVTYVALLGWTSGLVLEMLGQLEIAWHQLNKARQTQAAATSAQPPRRARRQHTGSVPGAPVMMPNGAGKDPRARGGSSGR